MLTDHIPAELIFFFILYGITGVVLLMAALYLLLRRSNAFAPAVTPPVSLSHRSQMTQMFSNSPRVPRTPARYARTL